MSTNFEPSGIFREGSEKDWPAKLGGLDWDSTRIVFTKRTLIEFLRYTGTSVDPNLNNISKLPRYADFGKMTGDENALGPGIPRAGSGTVGGSGNDDFKPSRRVRSVPGEAQTFTLGDGSEDPFDTGPTQNTESPSLPEDHSKEIPNTDAQPADGPAISGFKPSRRVREGPGGHSSMANLWDERIEAEEFKPTRRVREGPGGKDNISQLFE